MLLLCTLCMTVACGQDWSDGPAIPAGLGRSWHACAAFEERFYALGGYAGGSYLDSVIALQGETWAAAPSMREIRRAFGSAVLEVSGTPRLFAVGGRRSSTGYLSTVESFDGLAWRSEASLAGTRYQHAVVAFAGELYAIGGSRGVGLSGVEVYTAATASWAPGSPMASARSQLAASVFRGAIYALGGYGGSGALATVESFDGSAWSSAPSMLEPRYQHAAATYADRLVAVGGYTLVTAEAYDGVEWVSLGEAVGSTYTSSSFYHMCAGAFAGQLYVAGSSQSRNGVRILEASTWTAGEWSACDQSCGGGSQSRDAMCPGSGDCLGTQPATTQECNPQACESTERDDAHTATAPSAGEFAANGRITNESDDFAGGAERISLGFAALGAVLGAAALAA